MNTSELGVILNAMFIYEKSFAYWRNRKIQQYNKPTICYVFRWIQVASKTRHKRPKCIIIGIVCVRLNERAFDVCFA